MLWPLEIGISEISSPDLDITGVDSGMTSSRPDSLGIMKAMGFKRRDSLIIEVTRRTCEY